MGTGRTLTYRHHQAKISSGGHLHTFGCLLTRTAIRLWGSLSEYTRKATRSDSKIARSSNCKLFYGQRIRGANSRGCAFPREIVLSGPLDEALNQQGDSHEIYDVEDELPILH
jgi:hypothetical protein